MKSWFGILITVSLSIPWAAAADLAGTVKVRGLRDSANVVVSLGGVNGTTIPAPKHAVMDQKSLTFEPHILAVYKGTTVDFPNSDKVRHNVYSPAGSVKRFNLGTYPAGTSKSEEFDAPGIVPLACNVHSEMSGYIVVLDTPYFAITDKFGRFSIKGVPPGKYVVHTWHEKMKPVQQEITVAAAPSPVQLELNDKK